MQNQQLIIIVSIFAGILLINKLVKDSIRRRKQAKLDDFKQQQQAQANAAGIRVTSDTRQANQYFPESTGGTSFSGTEDGIAWTLGSLTLDGNRQFQPHYSRLNWVRSTYWKTESMRLPASKFILMMSTPGVDNSKHQLKHGGFLNEIMNSLADSFLHIYVAGYFGPKYISLVHIGSDTVKIDKPELKRFFILTNDEPAANQFFSPATIQYLSQWITSRPTFNRDQNVDYFGLLVSPEGIFLSCRASMENVDEVKMFSDLGVTLTKNWKNTIAQPSTAS